MNKKGFIWVLVLVMVLSAVAPVFAQEMETPLVFSNGVFSEKFHPIYSTTAYDQDVHALTQVNLLTTDRVGGIVYNAIEGETIPYNGVDYTYNGIADVSVKYDKDADITTYTAKLRDDIVFSDGEPLTADDVIFSYYTVLDPSYVGSTTLNSYDIIGLKDYQTQTTSEVYERFDTLAKQIYEAGPDHEWTEADAWTKEQQDALWGSVDEKWNEEVQKIVDYVASKYLGYAAEDLGMTVEEIQADEGLLVASGMMMWGFAKYEEGVLTDGAGVEYNIADGERPTIEDMIAMTHVLYPETAEFFDVEAVDDRGHAAMDLSKDAFISAEAAKLPEMAAGVPNIEGIKKLDDYTVEVKLYGYSAPAVYQIFGISVMPLHYYGDKALYDYENNKFGFPFGDLSSVEKVYAPMGAGPYKFVKYENRVVYFEANDLYWEGAPKIKYFQFKETKDDEIVPGVETGTIDGSGNVSGNVDTYNSIKKINGNDSTTGPVITTQYVDNRGYGYIGINASTVNVGGDAGSEESKYLRKALGTVLAVYRDVVIDSYYGDAASVINYPISNTSWAAPQPTDSDYKIAFSVDVNGDPIYADGMSEEDKYAAALEAAKGYFEAAGYTFGEDGKLAEAPEGASLSYELIIPAGGVADHPAFGIVTDASNALATIGFELKINDPSDSNILWTTLDSGKAELWAAAWQTVIDPDMYQIYHSSNVIGKGGTDSNKYFIADEELDGLIMDARESDDQAYRKQLYKAALELVVDWAVEIPTYQRQNATIYSTERVNVDTFTPDITTFYGWSSEMTNIEMNAK